MGHIVRGHRWPGSVPFRIGSRVNATVRQRILDAIQEIETKTAWRFHDRGREADYILFRQCANFTDSNLPLCRTSGHDAVYPWLHSGYMADG